MQGSESAHVVTENLSLVLMPLYDYMSVWACSIRRLGRTGSTNASFIFTNTMPRIIQEPPRMVSELMIIVAQIPVARLLGQINLVRWHLQFLGAQLWNLLYNSLMAHRYMKWLLVLDINLSNRNESQLLRPPLVSALKSSGCLLRRRPSLPLLFGGYFFVGRLWFTIRCTC